MQISKKLENVTMRDANVALRYENMVMYVSLVAFFSMASIFLLILSL
jgi:hypothetical protein